MAQPRRRAGRTTTTPAVAAPFRQPRNPSPPPLDPALAEEVQAYVERWHREILPGR